MVIAMNTIAKPVIAAFYLPHWTFPRLSFAKRERRRATIDLIHSSPHLLRDIGVSEGRVGERGK
jgi:uncharacterized protein YjiS (DUF1127 family)